MITYNTETKKDGLPANFVRQSKEERQADLKQFGRELRCFDGDTIGTALHLGERFRKEQEFHHKDKL